MRVGCVLGVCWAARCSLFTVLASMCVGCMLGVCWGARCLLFASKLPFLGWELPLLHQLNTLWNTLLHQLNTQQGLCNSHTEKTEYCTLVLCKYVHRMQHTSLFGLTLHNFLMQMLAHYTKVNLWSVGHTLTWARSETFSQIHIKVHVSVHFEQTLPCEILSVHPTASWAHSVHFQGVKWISTALHRHYICQTLQWKSNLYTHKQLEHQTLI